MKIAVEEYKGVYGGNFRIYLALTEDVGQKGPQWAERWLVRQAHVVMARRKIEHWKYLVRYVAHWRCLLIDIHWFNDCPEMA